MTRLLTVRLSENQDSEADGEYRDEVVLARVLELVEQGYTSGYEPSWEISEEADALEASAADAGEDFDAQVERAAVALYCRNYGLGFRVTSDGWAFLSDEARAPFRDQANVALAAAREGGR